jgi:hypothetical protein
MLVENFQPRIWFSAVMVGLQFIIQVSLSFFHGETTGSGCSVVLLFLENPQEKHP